MTPHFSLKELTYSWTAEQKGIDNTPNYLQAKNLKRTAEIAERIRAEVLKGFPMIISSGFRGTELNKIIKGSKTSAHLDGLALDFTCPKFGTVQEVFNAIAKSGIEFDQLIIERLGGKEWIHLGLPKSNYRNQLMRIDENGTHFVTV